MAIDTSSMDATFTLDNQSAKQAFGAQVVAKPLDTMNSGSSGKGGAGNDFDFQTKVLAAGAVMGKGNMVNGKV
jgi:hypothetical protein